MQPVHEPKQVKCCNHDLIPICKTPTTGAKIFHLFLSSLLSRDRVPKFL
jgi:hypothetical protein